MISLILSLICVVMADEAQIYLNESFEDSVQGGFTSASHMQNLSLVNGGVDEGKALRVRVGDNTHYGTSIAYRFQDAGLDEPEALHGRYYVKFGKTWDPGRGGKLPGISGTYRRAGWGGRPVDGTNGWSARMSFRKSKIREGETQISYYSYHADMKGQYGSSFRWENEGRGSLANDRWYCIETYVSMNTPGENDGVLRGWVDGEPAMEKTDIRFRDVDSLKVEQFWFNIYYGGKWAAPADMHIDFDSVVLSDQRVGCLGESKSKASHPPAAR